MASKFLGIVKNWAITNAQETASVRANKNKIEPSYNPPTRKKVAGPLLLDEYEELKTSVKEKIEKARYVNLVSDGWSNMRNEHVVNFIILIPNEETPIYFKSLFTADIRQTGENIATEIIRVIEEIEPDKVVSVVTDNAPNMASAWTIIETNFPKIFANGCAAHGFLSLVTLMISSETTKPTSVFFQIFTTLISGTRLLNYEMFWERQRRSLENLKKTIAGCPKYTILSENSKNCKTRMTFSKNVFETAGIFFIRNLWVGLICSIRQPKVVLEWLETTEERQLLN